MHGHHNKTGTVFVALDWSEVDVVKNPNPTTPPPFLRRFLIRCYHGYNVKVYRK